MSKVHFGVVGGGWRAEFYMRIARALPDLFHIDGMVVRQADKGAAIEREWGIPTYRSLAELLAAGRRPSFMVTAVPWAANAAIITELVEHGLPVLSETPAGPDMESMLAVWRLVEQGARLQVAEQYIYQPLHAARLAFIATGVLGTISHVQVSVAHGYHGISLIRHFLGVGLANAVIEARQFTSPVVAGPSRKGPPEEERLEPSEHILAIFDFQHPAGRRIGVFDWDDEQYFSWIRNQRVLVRGERGEIINDQAYYLADFRTPIQVTFRRVNAGEGGNLEGYHLKGYTVGGNWIYRNPFAPGRLSDDEIAVATSLYKMHEYVAGGPSFYSWAEACQDRYLDLCLSKALKTGAAVQTETQLWATI